MTKKILIVTSLIYVACLLQSTVLGYIEIHGIRPNLLLIVAVSVALLRNDLESAFTGLALGLGMDILVGRAVGWYGLGFFLANFIIARINPKLYKENPLIPVFFAFTSTLAIETLYYLITFFLKGYEDFLFVVTKLILPECLYNAVLSYPVFKLVSLVYRKIDKYSLIRT
ncbi:rod shape-determining protein MreD [Thermoclostridium stercorarium subsp. stercorarium DSM 8532]|jgi:rod shape-determining protein MreD|uniref:Rod shape-determining protein MreD n=3 Tax=Thermoclostridium stercorarium TaxID=1510 RepID=L7VKS9_THES1|nr:rod shape-determining protein MreD [Thermoclostridium stercorarium]AGC67357.1 rod shape-determining protein MreD [Thermoclostridium stercorarium subsp. stercorarium DSM 8532]AGI38418.1 MreD [Thermoclostridium stercorarium subsp. stercorarium DSM 8532]ANW97851.1 rod shape-determining protein MreD [Thermoclostridium stercorarium subsp. thermolacticum DSM 2910]ANX00405.1 rod shape-determining protein MreD [Thermoclostridium stercorarium subsp. leptospartum DSM 9219]UZQ85950.1 rod shape-determi